MSRAFANLDGLMRLSRTQGVDIRPALLRVLTDLYVQESTHTRKEVQQYAELALRLLPVVDAPTRTAVGRKLAAYRLTPVVLIEYLLRTMPDLAELKTISIVGTAKPAESSDEPETSGAAQPGSGASAALERLARSRSAAHGGAPPLGMVFLQAVSAEREQLLLRFEQQAVARAADQGWPAAVPAAIERLEAAALERDQHAFARELQRSVGLSAALAWQIVRDEGGEPLLVAAKALGMTSDVLLRVLLLLNPAIGCSVERVFSLMRLDARIAPAAAAPIVASWREQSRARSAAHFQSVHAADAPATRGLARETARPPAEAEPGARPVLADPQARRQDTT